MQSGLLCSIVFPEKHDDTPFGSLFTRLFQLIDYYKQSTFFFYSHMSVTLGAWRFFRNVGFQRTIT